jgi:hypothetical protein
MKMSNGHVHLRKNGYVIWNGLTSTLFGLPGIFISERMDIKTTANRLRHLERSDITLTQLVKMEAR